MEKLNPYLSRKIYSADCRVLTTGIAAFRFRPKDRAKTALRNPVVRSKQGKAATLFG